MTSRNVFIAATLVGLLAAAGFFLSNNTSWVDERATTPVLLTWREGSTQRYRITSDSSMVMGISANTTGQSIDVLMSALLDVMTLATDRHSALVGMQLSNASISIAGQADPERSQSLLKPFRVRFVDGGIPAEFEFQEGVDAEARMTLVNLIRHFQVSIDGNKPSWLNEEIHSSGIYEAQYQRISPAEITKTKKHFVAAKNTPMLNGAAISSTESIRLDPDRDWIVFMSVQDTLKSEGQGTPPLKISNHIQIELISHSLAQYSQEHWDFPTSARPPEPEALASANSKLSPEQARQQILTVLPRLDTDTGERVRLIHELRDLLRVDGSLPQILLDALQTEDLKDRTRADLYLALSMANTEMSQQALMSVFEGALQDQGWTTKDAMRAIVALSRVNSPSTESITALWAAAENASTEGKLRQIGSTATLALGSLGNTLNKQQDANYFELRSQLLQGANTTTGTQYGNEQRTDFVYALGNTGDPELADDVEQLLDDDSASVRRAAALSLGQLGVDQTADTILSRLKVESSQAVRGALVESLVEWDKPSDTAITTISDQIRKEPDEKTRYNMARFLSTNLEKFPENEAVLRELLRNEPSRRIRQTVAEALAQNKNS